MATSYRTFKARRPSALLARLARETPGSRRRLVEEIALGLARGFRDPGSTRFYAWAVSYTHLTQPTKLEV